MTAVLQTYIKQHTREGHSEQQTELRRSTLFTSHMWNPSLVSDCLIPHHASDSNVGLIPYNYPLPMEMIASWVSKLTTLFGHK